MQHLHLKNISIVHLELFDLAFLHGDWGANVLDLKRKKKLQITNTLIKLSSNMLNNYKLNTCVK